MVNWQAKAQEQQEEYINDLITMMKIPSVRDDAQATDEFPLGPEPATALKVFLEMAQQDGFKVKNIDNVVGYAQWGEGDETLAILAHVDVMPAGNGWDTDPFNPVIKDGNFYGRGASDDKGPGMAAYYAMKTLKDMGVVPNKTVRFIVGTDEESNWTGMKRYFEVEPAPTYGFSPDASFPLINGEKGNFSLKVDFKGANDGRVKLVSFDSGLRPNMVPRDAEAVIEGGELTQLMQALDEYLAQTSVTGKVIQDGEQFTISFVGKAAHGMEPKNGDNAGTYLANFLKHQDIHGDAGDFLEFVGSYLHVDSRLKNFELDYTDELMGELTMNVGLMNFKAEDGGQIDLNFRYPQGITPNDIQVGINKVTDKLHAFTYQLEGMLPHYVSTDDPLVVSLMASYREITGDVDALPEVVGGGTYGRMMERGVAFGALFPHTPDTMHQVNEFQPVDDLITAMAIYMDGINRLITD
ncbi:dipeptidase PepV [Paucilactobacillus nenjiangensis]|uniref:Dipeptidase PepV n=1 Tax=Paucilactobacillus nenjiangensis TaxID=1296540 RepID=A0A5P1X4K0_9LACO|nr:dipeptidase PepV [Paucilactobacillus nenjiangensis]QER67208.1 dipeptidase PepV [Paucilactobacillus nenjiangensis]